MLTNVKNQSPQGTTVTVGGPEPVDHLLRHCQTDKRRVCVWSELRSMQVFSPDGVSTLYYLQLSFVIKSNLSTVELVYAATTH